MIIYRACCSRINFARRSLLIRYGWLVILFFIGILPLSAQELNAEVKVNSSMIRGGNRQLFNTLEGALRSFINGRKWTESSIRAGERIDCSFTLVITEAPSSRSFRGELYVQSHRKMRNNGYVTPMLNWHDREMEFDYTEHQPLQFDPNFMQGNLTATVAYYAYLILGLDLDSRSLMGGTSCFRSMELIASNALSYGWKGWERRNNPNRSVITAAFNDRSSEEYRYMWFGYHSKGLDMSVGNGEPGLENVFSSILMMPALQGKRTATVLVKLFGDAKLDEVVALLSKADTGKKQQAYEVLLKLYPTRAGQLERLR